MCSKSPPTAIVAEVNIHAARDCSRYWRSGPETSSGVRCRVKPRWVSSYQSTESPSPGSRHRCNRFSTSAARSDSVAKPGEVSLSGASPLARSSTAVSSIASASVAPACWLMRTAPPRFGKESMRRRSSRTACSSRTHRLLHHRQRPGHVRRFLQRVARQFQQLARADAVTEELRGEFRQLVRLVEHEGRGAGQDLAEAFLLDREVREQQVMVDHHDVGGLRLLARAARRSTRDQNGHSPPRQLSAVDVTCGNTGLSSGCRAIRPGRRVACGCSR